MHPAASPSKPSVRFTALLEPVMTIVLTSMKPARPSGSVAFLKNGK